MLVNDEMRIGTVGVETGAHRQDRPIGARDKLPQAWPERFLVGGAEFSVDLIRIGLRSWRVKRELEPRTLWRHRKSIPDASGRSIDRPDRQRAQLKQRGL